MAYRTRVFIDFWNFSLNWKERADGALIDWTTVPRVLSSDADHIPAVEWVQARGKKVINATWANHGFNLKRTCWAEIELDAVMPLMKR